MELCYDMQCDWCQDAFVHKGCLSWSVSIELDGCNIFRLYLLLV